MVLAAAVVVEGGDENMQARVHGAPDMERHNRVSVSKRPFGVCMMIADKNGRASTDKLVLQANSFLATGPGGLKGYSGGNRSLPWYQPPWYGLSGGPWITKWKFRMSLSSTFTCMNTPVQRPSSREIFAHNDS